MEKEFVPRLSVRRHSMSTMLLVMGRAPCSESRSPGRAMKGARVRWINYSLRFASIVFLFQLHAQCHFNLADHLSFGSFSEIWRFCFCSKGLERVRCVEQFRLYWFESFGVRGTSNRASCDPRSACSSHRVCGASSRSRMYCSSSCGKGSARASDQVYDTRTVDRI